jgi:hypothetical protein
MIFLTTKMPAQEMWHARGLFAMEIEKQTKHTSRSVLSAAQAKA